MQFEYVDLLAGEYAQRRNSNELYSERAFARTLGLSPGYLKLLFQGKKRLSLLRARDVVARLNWTELKKRQFLSCVETSSFKNQRRLRQKVILKEQIFFELSDWFHFAVVELIKTNAGVISLPQVCSKLGLAETEANFALNNLTRIGLLTRSKNGKYKAPEHYEMPSVSSLGIRKFHAQTLRLALAAIEGQSPEERELRGLTLAFEKKRLLEAKTFISKFVSDFEKRFGGTKPDSVYQLSLALFRLDKDNK